MKTLQLTRRLYLGILAATLILTGCDVDGILPCENGDGVRVTEPRSNSEFDRVVLDLPGDVYITQGSDFKIDITAQQNIIDEIETEVVGNTLEIRNDRCFRSYKTIKIDITMPNISALEVNGSGDIYVTDAFTGTYLDLFVKGSGSIDMIGSYQRIFQEINGAGDISLDARADEIESSIKGSGDILMIGSTTTHLVDIQGSGNLEAFELITDDSDISIKASGGADVYVNNTLKVKINGSGDVRYKGTPSVEADITGSGQLESVN